jgi:hypothetical protein
MLSRREFLVAGGALAVIPLSAIGAPPRAPFLEVGDNVSFLYFEDWVRPFQPYMISATVAHVGVWNGTAYPIVLSYCVHKEREYWDGLDGEWCMFRKEIPNFSWRDVSRDRYSCIHAYVREKRFGEDPRIMAAQMEHSMKYGPPLGRGVVPRRATLLA